MRFVKKLISICILWCFVDVGFFERVCFGIDFLSVVAFIFGIKNSEKNIEKGFKHDIIFEIDFWTVLGTVLGLILGGFWEAKLKNIG